MLFIFVFLIPSFYRSVVKRSTVFSFKWNLFFDMQVTYVFSRINTNNYSDMIVINSLELWQSPRTFHLIKTQYCYTILMEPRSEKWTCRVKPNRRQFQWRLIWRPYLLRHWEDFIVSLHQCTHSTAARYRALVILQS